MRQVKGKNTAPEIAVRRIVHGAGYRFRLYKKNLPGKPDLVFASRNKAIFVHGCFWHGHGCKIGKLPKSRLSFWKPKIARNRERDEENLAALATMGWRTLVVWQCETKNRVEIRKRLVKFLGRRGKPRATKWQKRANVKSAHRN